MPATKIDHIIGTRLHKNYIRNLVPETPGTRALIFELGEFKKVMDIIIEKNNNLVDTNLHFICYFGRYDNTDGTNLSGKNTIILQFATTDLAGDTVAIADEIYNFGDLRPPKIVIGENIMP